MLWILAQKNFLFEWDEGNKTKSKQKHGVTCAEVESVFDDPALIRALGIQSSPETSEKRFALFGQSVNQKCLFVCFTIRKEKIRVISARELNKKEEVLYEKLCK